MNTVLEFSEDCYLSFFSFNLNESIVLSYLKKGRVIVLDVIASTNQYIIDHLQFMDSGDACVTDNQTQGRGKYGNFWISPPGQCICLSVYWQLHGKLVTVFNLSFMISFVIAMVLKKIGVFSVQIKWPNDIYVNGRKLAGILIENVIKNNKYSHLIVGVGINICISNYTKLNIKISKKWIDLKDAGVYPNINLLVAILINEIRGVLKQFECNIY